MGTHHASAEIERADTTELGDLWMIPPRVRRRLGPRDRKVGLVFIRHGDRCYRLVIDLEWLQLAATTLRRHADSADSFPLPRAAVEAVIDGWVDSAEPSIPDVWWADDGVPHVSARAAAS